MNFGYSQEEDRFRLYVRDFLKKHATLEIIEQTSAGIVRGPAAREFVREMAKDGLLGLTWPREYGGKEMPPAYDFILNDECAYAHMPQPGKGVGIIGRTLMHHGNEILKRKFLPMILKEEVEFAIGYTEPDAGSDLASLKIQAKEDGDDYVINGPKLFCSSAHVADWIWLLGRTDPQLPKHKGVSLFLVDVNLPGITIREIKTLGGDRTNAVFFDDVRVPKEYLVGERGKGFQYGMEALAYERHVLFPAGYIKKDFDVLLQWVKESELDGVPMAKDPVVRRTVARLAIEMETSQMLELGILAATQKGEASDIVAAMHKLYGCQLMMRVADTGLDLMGAYGQLQKGSDHVPADGELERFLRFSVLQMIGGGSSEIQKNIIAKRALGLPG